MRIVRTISPLLACVALVAGCGSSSNSSSTSSAPAASATQSTSSGGYSRYGSSSSTTASASAAQPIVITTKHSKLGTILAAGPKRMTVYLFEADKGGASACSGQCAAAWPPVTGKATATGSAAGSDLGTIKRADGKTQVTYKGHPLYYFIKDKDDGDAYGEAVKAFGAEWYVLAPSGNKIDKS